MQLTTEQASALLRLVAELTEQRDTACANFQRLNREWDEYEQRAQIERASQGDPEDAALLEVLRAWNGLAWRWHYLRDGSIAYAEVPHGEWQVEFRRGEPCEAVLLFARKGVRGVAEVERKVSGATRLAALVGIVARGLPPLREDGDE